MRNRFLTSLALTLISGIALSQTPRSDLNGQHLLKTAWSGSAPFNAFVPGQRELGCHSVALAQVLCFHQLAPSGRVSYQCSDGTVVNADFSRYKPRWETLAMNPQSAGGNPEASRETAKFLYAVAGVVRKNFGTDQYVNYQDDCHKEAIESHFQCELSAQAREVTTTVSEAINAVPTLHSLMTSELGSGRPVGFYYTDRNGGGHAVVLDGYLRREESVYYHANFGWGGRSDGWYSLEEDLPQNLSEIIAITIVPTDTVNPGKSAPNPPD